MEGKSTDRTHFYNRKELTEYDIMRLIRLWEDLAGESFVDCCCFSKEVDNSFLEFLKNRFPVLYNYHKEIPELKDDVLDVLFSCEEYLTQWIPEGFFHIKDKMYEMTLYILSYFILTDDKAFEEFEKFFMSKEDEDREYAMEALDEYGLHVGYDILI